MSTETSFFDPFINEVLSICVPQQSPPPEIVDAAFDGIRALRARCETSPHPVGCVTYATLCAAIESVLLWRIGRTDEALTVIDALIARATTVDVEFLPPTIVETFLTVAEVCFCCSAVPQLTALGGILRRIWFDAPPSSLILFLARCIATLRLRFSPSWNSSVALIQCPRTRQTHSQHLHLFRQPSSMTRLRSRWTPRGLWKSWLQIGPLRLTETPARFFWSRMRSWRQTRLALSDVTVWLMGRARSSCERERHHFLRSLERRLERP